MAIKRSTCLTVNRSRWFSLASQRRMNDTQTVFDRFNFAVTFRLLWRRSSSPSLRSTRIGVAPFRKFHTCVSSANSTFPIFYASYSRIFLSTSFLLSFSRTFTKLCEHFTRYTVRNFSMNFLKLFEDREVFESRRKTAIQWCSNLTSSRPTNEHA